MHTPAAISAWNTIHVRHDLLFKSILHSPRNYTYPPLRACWALPNTLARKQARAQQQPQPLPQPQPHDAASSSALGWKRGSAQAWAEVLQDHSPCFELGIPCKICICNNSNNLSIDQTSWMLVVRNTSYAFSTLWIQAYLASTVTYSPANTSILPKMFHVHITSQLTISCRLQALSF